MGTPVVERPLWSLTLTPACWLCTWCWST
jgi:hypothetical protein